MLKFSDAVVLSAEQKSELLGFAVRIAGEAGLVTLPYFRAPVEIENKLDDGRFDPVTEADRAAEQVIRRAVQQAYPEHGVYGEEYGHQEGNGLTWVIDPIDGTRAFMAGMVHWGVLVGLFDGQRPVLGVMHQPFTNEYFLGDGGVAEYRRGDQVRKLQVSSTAKLQDAVLATTSPTFFQSESERAGFEALERKVKLARYGGDCYIYAMLAMGYIDLAVDSGLKPYDIQALMPIIEGAGGVVSCADGSDASMGGLVVASGNAELHRQALETFSIS